MEECVHEVLVADPRKVRLIYANKRKTDNADAQNLARLARVDPKLLYPLKHRGEDSQAHMALIRSRQALVSCRTQLVNHVRGAVKSFGYRLPKCPARTFHKRAQERARPRGAFAGARAHRRADRLAYGAHPRIRPRAAGDLRGASPRNWAPAPGRGDRASYCAYLRAHLRRPPPLRKEPIGRSILGAGACQRSVGRRRSPETHLQGGRRDA